jgi:hypothetical protein
MAKPASAQLARRGGLAVPSTSLPSSPAAPLDLARVAEQVEGLFGSRYRKVNISLYCTPEGEALADLMSTVNREYGIGLEQIAKARSRVADDNGSFIEAGFMRVLASFGSYPYADPQYHLEGDIPERTDTLNARLTAQATLAALLTLDRQQRARRGTIIRTSMAFWCGSFEAYLAYGMQFGSCIVSETQGTLSVQSWAKKSLATTYSPTLKGRYASTRSANTPYHRRGRA